MYDHIVGRPVEEANDLLNLEGKVMRVRWMDGRPQLGTADFNLNRINVEVARGRVTRIIGVG